MAAHTAPLYTYILHCIRVMWAQLPDWNGSSLEDHVWRGVVGRPLRLTRYQSTLVSTPALAIVFFLCGHGTIHYRVDQVTITTWYH